MFVEEKLIMDVLTEQQKLFVILCIARYKMREHSKS